MDAACANLYLTIKKGKDMSTSTSTSTSTKVKSTVIKVDGKPYLIRENDSIKTCNGEGYNYTFNKKNGFFARYGNKKEDDPDFSPVSCEIADIEITTSCSGVPNKNGIKSPCNFCYKSNTANGKYMTLGTFKKIFDNIKKGGTITQIAFGVDSECKSNPEWFEIFKYAKDNGVIPNVTVANIDDETADKLASICGAVAVSRYDNKDICYNTVKKLTDRGLAQVNIHHLASMESYDNLIETLSDSKTDPRLAKLNAIVILSLKKCGRGVNLNSLPQEKFSGIITYAFENDIRIGFDSCSCHKFLSSISNLKEELRKRLELVSEPCESTLFSIYIDVDGKVHPCSFCENIEGWEDGIDVTIPLNFIKEVWYHPKVVTFRNMLIKNKRACPIYKV